MTFFTKTGPISLCFSKFSYKFIVITKKCRKFASKLSILA